MSISQAIVCTNLGSNRNAAQLRAFVLLMPLLLACAPPRRPAVARYPSSPPGAAVGYPPMMYPPMNGPPAWGPAYAPAAPPQAPPAFAHVTFVGVVAALSKTDRSYWDIGGSVSGEDVQKVAVALGAADPYAAVLGVVAGLAIPAMQKPDIAGTATLWTSVGGQRAFDLAKHQDSYTPQWNVSWPHVPLDGSARIRVTLTDLDWQFHDSMGTFEINAEDIRVALASQRVYSMRVDKQTGGQILLAAISAIAERP